MLLSSIYRPPSYSKNHDQKLEANIENAYLLNKETILLGDFNIDFQNASRFKKHHLSKVLRSMNFKQMVNDITRPISSTCLDHIYSNHPERVMDVRTIGVGLSDHLPLVMVRKYARSDPQRCRNTKFIKYRNMKNFNANNFITTSKEVPWDTVFLFDDIDDMLESWESLFNSALDSHCPWRDKRVKNLKQAPWIN